jgi:hypothetical protein
MTLFDGFPRIEVPGTGRPAFQLTSGPDFCYPLYYFIPSISSNGRYLVHHRETPGEPNEIQLHRLDLATGESAQLTNGTCPEAKWNPWGVDDARGVLGDRAALNVARDELVYFDGNRVRVVNVVTREDRAAFDVPEDRFPLAQNCCTPDGKWFVYVHADRANFGAFLAAREKGPGTFPLNVRYCEGTQVAAWNFDTGEHRTLLHINSPLHHVFAYDDTHLVLCHPAGEKLGMLLTDLRGGWWKLMRTRDAMGGAVCHYVATERGIAYEVVQRPDHPLCGMYNPYTDDRYEFAVPSCSHVGCDPTGRLFFCDQGGGRVAALTRHDPQGDDTWLTLAGPWKTYGKGQKSHLHPRVTPDHRFIQMVGGDSASETNHIFLVDITDVPDTEGLPGVLQA